MNELILFFLHLNIPFLPLLLSFVYFSFALFFSPSSILKNSPSLSLPPPTLFLSLLFSDHRSFLSSTFITHSQPHPLCSFKLILLLFIHRTSIP
ncbi:MAG: hypothetical protein JOS17DRAFT_757515, partial [Linnemannia elongata]